MCPNPINKVALKLRNTITPKTLLARFVKQLSPRLLAFDEIRLGDSFDGGYVLPNCLNRISWAVNPGVGDTISFDIAALNDYGIRGVTCDGTLDSSKISKLALDTFAFFEPKNLGLIDSEATICLETLTRIAQTIIRKDDEIGFGLLQLDIEGGEWEILKSKKTNLDAFGIVIVEFHGFHLAARLLSFFRFIKPTFQRLLRDFEVFHIHPNNGRGKINIHGIDMPEIMEITFVSKKLANFNGGKTAYKRLPSYFDSDNVPENPKIEPLRGWPGWELQRN